MLIFIKPLILELGFARMLKWDLEVNYAVYGVFLVFAIVVGILAGLFPAVVLSGFQPSKVLKSLNTMKLFSNMGLRKALLVAQFTFSLIFILTVIIVFSQLKLFMRADHGFNIDNKIVLQLNGTSPEALKNELLKYPNVESVTAASHIPAAGTTMGNNFKKSMDDKDWNALSYYFVDEDYLKNIEVPLVAGRFFSPADGTANKNFIVVSEMALSIFQLGSPTEALGQQLFLQTDSSRKKIIGVLRNYNHQLLMQKMEPMGLMYDTQRFQVLQIKYSGSFENAGGTIRNAWTKINPMLKVDSKDFAGEVHKIYDIFFGDLVDVLGVIAALAILISCLGLLGMATYTTETRIKEISIRKVLGSSNGSLIYLLSKGFFAILLMAIVIAVPAAYFISNLWLEQLAYHVTVSIPMILFGVIILIVFGALTIGSQTWRAAFVKPVENLKGE